MVTTEHRPSAHPLVPPPLTAPGIGHIPIPGNAAIYVRVSGHRQEDGASLDVQMETCRKYCESHSFDVVAEFKDVQSGLDVDRPAYQGALLLARSKGFDHLVVYRYDRSGRDDAEYMGMLRDFAKLGITLVSASGESPDPLFQKLAGVLAWDESRRISIRSTGAKMKRFEEGYWNGKPPFGYVTERQPGGGSILVPKEGEAALIPQMFEMYATGDTSLGEVQRWVNSVLPTNQKKSRRGINQVLASRVYLGEVPYGQFVHSEFHPKPEQIEWRPGKHQALVNPETFDRVQQILHSNKRSYGRGSKGIPGPSRGGPKARYLFTGLTFCGACGSRYNGVLAGNKNWPTYKCGRKSSGIGCDSHAIYETRIREAVTKPIERLLALLNQEEVRAQVEAQVAQREQETRASDLASKASAAETLERLEARLTNLENAYLDGEIARDRYRARRDEITAQIAELKARLNERPRPVLPDVDQLFTLSVRVAIVEGRVTVNGEPLDNESWRGLVEGMVDRIVIEGRDIKVTWKPEYEAMIAMTGEIAT